MSKSLKLLATCAIRLLAMALLSLMVWSPLPAGDLDEVKNAGVLRHLGVPYAHFVTGSGDGLDVELITLFAAHLGVEYQYVETTWKDVLSDLTGKRFRVIDDDVVVTGEAPVRGDLIANGLTLLPWRTKLIDYSTPTFPSGVWLISKAEHPLVPIESSGDDRLDIDLVKEKLGGLELLGVENSCLDPRLYELSKTGAKITTKANMINPIDLVPTLLQGDTETTLLDVPDALIALNKWPGMIKVIGPISERQTMGVGFAKESTQLRRAFNSFFAQLKREGRYQKLAQKYYPSMFLYFRDFFASR